MKTYEEVGSLALQILKPRHQMEVSGQLLTQAALPPWIIFPCQKSNPGRPARSLHIILTSIF